MLHILPLACSFYFCLLLSFLISFAIIPGIQCENTYQTRQQQQGLVLCFTTRKGPFLKEIVASDQGRHVCLINIVV